MQLILSPPPRSARRRRQPSGEGEHKELHCSFGVQLGLANSSHKSKNLKLPN
ncbi:hypothetical protein LINPERHAP1_LOCUS37742 [Linum perenne]